MAVLKSNPKRLASLAVAGGFLCSTAYFSTFLPGFAGGRLRLLAFLCPAIAGLVLWILADTRLKKNYRAGVWSDEELASTRAFLAHPAWGWAGIASFLLGVLLAGFSKHHFGLIYFTIMPMSAASSLRTALAPPRKAGGGLIDWTSFKPIHSDRWGEPPHSHGDPLHS